MVSNLPDAARMSLSEEDLTAFRDFSLLFQTCALSRNLISAIVEQVEKLTTIDVPGRLMEQDGRTVRALHGLPFDAPAFGTACTASYSFGSS
jgi:hypothetical protein